MAAANVFASGIGIINTKAGGGRFLLDQMFTAENFRRIFDLENRKGLDLLGAFFPHLNPMTLAVKDKVTEIRTLRSKQATMAAEDFEASLATLKAELTALKAQKSAAIDAEMEGLSDTVSQSGFKLVLEQKAGPQGKPVFCIDGTAATFFVVKQLQKNVNRIYGVKQSNRHDLACQVRDTIRSSFPFEIVRTDVSAFYESIDRKRLLTKLDADQLLSSSSKKFIKQILDSYGALSGNAQGIPRGVGISAYLAELYLRKFDRDIRSIPGIVLYCRYVDDIVAVFARPPAGNTLPAYKDLVIDALGRHQLNHNPDKTAEIILGPAGVSTFEYLGYRFTVGNGPLIIAPSDAKLIKLKQRLEATFESYWQCAPINPRQAYREVVARVKFLTGNTRLLNSKSTAATGIYYNNPLVTDLKGFQALDAFLKSEIKAIKRPRLRERLLRYTLVGGFNERRFHNFGSRELAYIVKAWKHA